MSIYENLIQEINRKFKILRILGREKNYTLNNEIDFMIYQILVLRAIEGRHSNLMCNTSILLISWKVF